MRLDWAAVRNLSPSLSVGKRMINYLLQSLSLNQIDLQSLSNTGTLKIYEDI